MADQWYLDLDGTRSGPYPTNEVLSLIEEGEVLPHHRISRGLRNPDWITILDWRFEQAKAGLQTGASRATPSVSASASAQGPAPATSEAPAQPAPSGPKIKLSLNTRKVPERPSESKAPAPTPSPVPTFSPSQPEFQKTAQSLSPAPDEAIPTPRDPMAEMFDLLQNTKHKREAKQAQQAQHSLTHAESSGSSAERGSFGKLIVICVAVAIIGLVLGQVFQGKLKSSPTSNAPNAASNTTSSPAPKAEGSSEVLDRSNDKITIKSVVEKGPAPARTPYLAPTPFRREETNLDRKPVDQELEELRDLKKELQELKSLKEQLKENPTAEEFSQPDGSAQPLEGEPPAGGASPGITTESHF